MIPDPADPFGFSARSTAGKHKQWWAGSHRTRRPDATLADLLPHLPFYGITRLADLTGLDRIGVPVFAAVRPRTRSLSVSQGKGIDAVQAKVSALVEAIELWSAERVPLESGGANPMVLARDLADGRLVRLPWAQVSLDARVGTTPRASGSSNGLAGGNTRSEAVLHGLCELIERDALFRTESTARFSGGLIRIDPDSLGDPMARRIVRKLDFAGVLHAVWLLPSAIGSTVCLCHVMDEQEVGDEGQGWAHGSGCHPDPTVAWLRAVTEALQARLTHISGARDDTGWGRYAPLDRERLARQRAVLRDRSGLRPLQPAGRYQPKPTVDEDVADILQALARAGKGSVHAVDLDPGPAPLAVVKLVAPSLREARR